MLTSLCLVFLVGLAMSAICEKIKIPKIIGMLITGLVLGPYVLDCFDPKILGISKELRQMALVIILIKAGLSLNLKDLKVVGLPALLLSFVPATFEICAYVIFMPLFFYNGNYADGWLVGAITGCVLSAVSPAVVVPRMVKLMDEHYGTDKKIPQMILAGASLDDVFVIVLFTTFLGLASEGTFDALAFLDIPSSIILGILLGVIVGFIVNFLFEICYKFKNKIRNSVKVIVILGVSFGLLFIEDVLEPYVAVSGLLAIMAMSMVVGMRSIKEVTLRLQAKFGKLWIAAELLLFVLVGAAVNIDAIKENPSIVGWSILMIFIALIFRSVGTFLCTLAARGLNWKERLFCIIAYLPKATVQAAIGSVPKDEGLPFGDLVLTTAVLGIIITAPLGAFGMDLTYKKLLTKEEIKEEVEEIAPQELEAKTE